MVSSPEPAAPVGQLDLPPRDDGKDVHVRHSKAQSVFGTDHDPTNFMKNIGGHPAERPPRPTETHYRERFEQSTFPQRSQNELEEPYLLTQPTSISDRPERQEHLVSPESDHSYPAREYQGYPPHSWVERMPSMPPRQPPPSGDRYHEHLQLNRQYDGPNPFEHPPQFNEPPPPPPPRHFEHGDSYSYQPPPLPHRVSDIHYPQRDSYSNPRASYYNDGYSNPHEHKDKRQSPGRGQSESMIPLSRMLNPVQVPESPMQRAEEPQWEEARPPPAKRPRVRTMSALPPEQPENTFGDMEMSYTSDSATKLNERLRRQCFNCLSKDTSTWRRSTLVPGKMLCNKCGLFERTHSRARPDQVVNRRLVDSTSSPPLLAKKYKTRRLSTIVPSIPSLPPNLPSPSMYNDGGRDQYYAGPFPPPPPPQHEPFDTYGILPPRPPSRDDHRQYAPLPSYANRHHSESPNIPYYSPAIHTRSPYVPSQHHEESQFDGRGAQPDYGFDHRPSGRGEGHNAPMQIPPYASRFEPRLSSDDSRPGTSAGSSVTDITRIADDGGSSPKIPMLKRRRSPQRSYNE